MGQIDAVLRGNLPGELKLENKNVSPMERLARSTEATLQAYKKLRDTEAAVGGKLTELVEKTAEAEELWRRYTDSRELMNEVLARSRTTACVLIQLGLRMSANHVLSFFSMGRLFHISAVPWYSAVRRRERSGGLVYR